jgi:hypothetical protein
MLVAAVVAAAAGLEGGTALGKAWKEAATAPSVVVAPYSLYALRHGQKAAKKNAGCIETERAAEWNTRTKSTPSARSPRTDRNQGGVKMPCTIY